MTNALRELKIRAESLHKQTKTDRPDDKPRRRECLNAVARQWGFPGYLQARAALNGEAAAVEFGTLLYPQHGPTLNRWYSDYEEAKRDRAACDGYLLAFKRQFLVVGPEYIASLGLDPADTDWTALGRDWVSPPNPAARARLYDKLVAKLVRP
jgi:hypothetical protein